MGFLNRIFGNKDDELKGVEKSATVVRNSADPLAADFVSALSMQLRGENEPALQVYQRLAQESPEDTLVSFFSLLIKAEQSLPEAIEELRSLSRRIAEGGHAISHDIAVNLLAVASDRTLIKVPLVADLIVALAERSKKEGFLQEAAVLFEIAAAFAPDNAHVLHKFGDTLHDLRMYDYAEAVLMQALISAPNHWGALYTYAVLLQDLGRYDEAVSHYERAVRLYPDHAKCQNNFGAALLMANRVDEALEHCGIADRLDPKSPLVKVNLGNIYLMTEQYEKARVAFSEAIALEERMAPAYFGLASAEQALGGDAGKIRDLYLEAAEINPNMPEFRHAAGNLLAAEGKPEALEHFAAAAQLNPGLRDLQRDFGAACLKFGRREEALEHLELALQQDPEDAAALELSAAAQGTGEQGGN